MNKDIFKFLDKNQICYEQNVDLKKKTWIHRGGIASLFILPNNKEQLITIASYLYKEEIEFLLVGHTSNIYILNTCNIDIVISTLRCNKYEVTNDGIICEAGVGVITLSKAMVENGIKGFEYLTGLPGTIGAAICNNSSCKENSISQLLISAEVLTSDGTIITMKPLDFEFQYRTSIFKQKQIKGVVLSAILYANREDALLLKNKAENNDLERRQILEGHANNLGCTVNQPWSLGPMPLLYRLQQSIFSIVLRLLFVGELTRRKLMKRQLFVISGYSDVEPYVSDKNPIVFMWLDEGADCVFDRYLQFMEKVYKTNSIEIQIIR